ncbi:MAG: hypothetical protein AAF789_01385 [Bacteroidota bacterium]
MFILRPKYQKGSKIKSLKREGILKGASEELVDFKLWDPEASWGSIDLFDEGN